MREGLAQEMTSDLRLEKSQRRPREDLSISHEGNRKNKMRQELAVCLRSRKEEASVAGV